MQRCSETSPCTYEHAQIGPDTPRLPQTSQAYKDKPRQAETRTGTQRHAQAPKTKHRHAENRAHTQQTWPDTLRHSQAH